MKLRLKLIIILSILVGGLITTLYVFDFTAVFGRYQILERNEVVQELGRVGNVLDDEISRIDSITKDWATWDDTYAFITDLNQDYTASNLVNNAFETNGINVMLFYDTSGTLRMGKAYDLVNRIETDIPTFFEGDIGSQGLLATKITDHAQGKLTLPEGTLLLSTRPIITSTGEGPVKGTLIMGRFLDADELLRITEILGIEVDIRSIGDPSLPADFQQALSAIEAGSTVEVTPVSRERVWGYTTLNDYRGVASLVVKITLPRDIYLEGEAAMQSFLVSFIIIGLGVGAVGLALNNWLFVKPIVSLSKRVAEIGRKQDFDERLPVVGDDERASLSRDINTMLDSLKAAKEREIEQREKVEEFRRGHIRELLDGARRITNSVKYDLRSPLQVIKNATYLLREDPKRAESLADMIDESVEDAVSTIEDLSNMTQIGELKITITDLRYLIELSVEVAKVPENIKVVEEFSEEFLAILLDVAKVQRVLDNLINNAVEAMPSGGTLTLRNRKTNDFVEIEVEDTGVGIEPGEMDKLFQPFYTTKPMGTGLGLVYSKEVVEALGGTIKIDSKPGVGTRVTIVLPIKNA